MAAATLQMMCIGADKFNTPGNYSWYVPNGRLARDITYCQWCYDNGCCDKNEVYKMDIGSKGINANCDCEKEHLHTLTKLFKHTDEKDRLLKCPGCYFEDYLTGGGRLVPADMSNCRSCGAVVTSSAHTKCNNCSIVDAQCFICHKDFKIGDEYFNDFWTKIFKQPDADDCFIDEKSGAILFVLQRIRGKTVPELLSGVLDGTLYRNPIPIKVKLENMSKSFAAKYNW